MEGMSSVWVDGRWYEMRMRQAVGFGVPERCPVNVRLQERFGLVREEAIPCFIPDHLIPRTGGRLILFTDQLV
jgi:hypothetical protein